jgi:hypothetical protein
LRRLWECVWTLARVEDIEPMNNAPESTLWYAVI